MDEGAVPFDREQLETSLDDIGVYLAELYYIESVLRYRDDVHDDRWFVTQLVSRDARVPVPVELGVPAYRYTIELRVMPGTEEQVGQDLGKFRDEANQKALGNIEYFRSSLTSLLHPSVALYELIESRLRKTNLLHFEATEDDFGELRNLEGNWYGLAARDFYTEFYHPFAKVREVQGHVIDSVRAGFAISKGIARFSQTSLMNAVVSTRQALRDQLRGHSLAEPGISAKQVLMVTSSASSILSTATSASVLWSIASQGVSQVTGFVANNLPDDAESFTIEGRMADELLHGLVRARNTIAEYVNNQQDFLKQQLLDVQEQIDGLRDRLYPARPHLADEPVRGPTGELNDPDEFYFRGPEG